MNSTASPRPDVKGASTSRRLIGARLWTPLLSAFALLATAATGLWLRWDRLQLAEFCSDQAWVVNQAYNFVTGGPLPLAGIPTSVGTVQGPYELWLLALPLALDKDPRLATAFVGLLQVGALVTAYFLATRYFGRLAGLCAALLFAVNPWALQYSRKIWTPDLLPLFSALYFFALFAAVVDRKRYWFAVACLLWTVMFLIHPAAIMFAPVLVLVLALFWRRIGWRPLLLGGLLGLVAASPFLIYEAQRDFWSIRGYLGIGTAGAARFDLEALKFITTMASARWFPFMMGYNIRGDWALPSVTLQDDLATGLMAAGLAVATGAVAARLRVPGWAARIGWERYLLLLLWFVMPVAVSTRHSMPFQPHYLAGVYPLQFILIGVALASTVKAIGWLAPKVAAGSAGRSLPLLLTPVATAVALALTANIAWAHADYFRTYLHYVETQGPTRPYGIPLLYSQRGIEAINAARAALGGVPTFVYAYLQGPSLDYLNRPNAPLHHLDRPKDALLLPADAEKGALAVLASDDAAIAEQEYRLLDDGGPMLARLKAYGFAELPERAVRGPDGYTYYRLFHLPPGQASVSLSRFAPAAGQPRLAMGMQLLGYRAEQSPAAPEKMTVSLLWRMPDPLPGRVPERYEYNLFLHAVDHKGRELATLDYELYQHVAWRDGDLLVTFHDLSLPEGSTPGLVWFDVGAYSRYDREKVSWLEAGGKPAAEAVKVGPVAASGSAGPAPATPARFAFEQMELEGYTLDPASPKVGETLGVTLHWQVRGDIKGDYVVSTQLLDAGGKLVAQHDSPPREGAYPTTAWRDGDAIPDTHHLTLPEGPAGVYDLVVVVYDATTKERLRATTAAAGPAGDYIRLAQVRLAPR
jgi:hypothetical protein